jgi:glucosyl-3-phosphoglycerate synthase
MGYLLAEEKVDYMAFIDADIVNFRREMLARLVLPALDPIVDFDFVKAYYARYSDSLHGRVTRLFLSPLLAAFALTPTACARPHLSGRGCRAT